MKKNLIFIILLELIFGACSNKEIPKQIKPIEKFSLNFSIDNEMLVFPSPSEYEKLLDTLSSLGYNYFTEWDKNTPFKSVRTHFKENDLIQDLPICDELFAVILNTQYKVKIGEYTFQLNPETETIDVISSLKSNEASSFTFDDEIITLLFEKEESLKSTDACSYPAGQTPTVSWNCWGEEIVCKAHYYKAGIYNSIFVEMKLTNCLFSGVEMTLNTYENSDCSYNKCRSSRTLVFGETKTGCKIYKNLYRKTKRVNECDLKVDFSAVSADNACNDSRYLEILF